MLIRRFGWSRGIAGFSAGLALAASGCASKPVKQEFVGTVPDWRSLIPAQTSTAPAEPAPPIEDRGKADDIQPTSDTNAPPPTTQPDPPEDPSTFAGYVDQIKTVMPDTSGGVATALRIENQTTGTRTSYIFKTSTNFDSFADGAFYLAILSRNNEDLYIRIPKLRPGHYECPDFDLLLGESDKPLSDPETAQAANPGGSCELDLYPGNNPTDIQGKFTGRLMFNSGEFSYTIESGYLYARDALSHEYKPEKPRYPTNPTGGGVVGPGPQNPNQPHNYHR
ncbi:MAG: hypothetical protein U0414_27155 [Polyangiaceae bacterium]